eukprot:1933262-Lingulodinium_polyedra.AAC.1
MRPVRAYVAKEDQAVWRQWVSVKVEEVEAALSGGNKESCLTQARALWAFSMVAGTQRRQAVCVERSAKAKGWQSWALQAATRGASQAHAWTKVPTPWVPDVAA